MPIHENHTEQVSWKKENFEHFKVNNKYNFVDPETGTHTQKLERVWGSTKWRDNKHRRTVFSSLAYKTLPMQTSKKFSLIAGATSWE